MKSRKLNLHYRTVTRLTGLKKEAEQDGAYRVAKRIHAVLLNGTGLNSGDVATILKAPRSRVSEWLRRYETYDLDGLLEGQRSGRPAGLTAEHYETLSSIIDSGPVAYGYTSGVWTGPMVQRIIEDEFSVSYDPRHVRRILDKLGFSVQRPKRVLAKADPEQLQKWRRSTYPDIKKKPKR